MSYQELLEHKRTAVKGMAEAKDQLEKAVWIVLHRWATDEIRRQTTAMVGA